METVDNIEHFLILYHFEYIRTKPKQSICFPAQTFSVDMGFLPGDHFV